jgi:hypothetical protein
MNPDLDAVRRPDYVQAPYRIPTLHAFSRSVIYFFLSRQITPPTNAITVKAVASTGEKVTANVPLERIETNSNPLTTSPHFLDFRPG